MTFFPIIYWGKGKQKSVWGVVVVHALVWQGQQSTVIGKEHPSGKSANQCGRLFPFLAMSHCNHVVK